MQHGEFTQLEDLVLNDLINEWQLGVRAIDSKEVYDRLVRDGVTIHKGAMRVVFEALCSTKAIQVAKLINTESVETHGGVTIIWVDTTAISQT